MPSQVEYCMELWEELMLDFIQKMSRSEGERWVVMGNSIGGKTLHRLQYQRLQYFYTYATDMMILPVINNGVDEKPHERHHGMGNSIGGEALCTNLHSYVGYCYTYGTDPI